MTQRTRAWPLLVLALIGGCALAFAQEPPAQYTLADYDSFQIIHGRTDGEYKIRLLDEFVVRYPESAMLPYVYQDYVSSYFRLRNYPKAVEYADKLISVGDSLGAGVRLTAFVTREYAFTLGCAEAALQTPEAYAGARDAAAEGLRVLAQLEKPAGLTEGEFAGRKQATEAMFRGVAGLAEAGLNGPVVDPCKDVPLLDPGAPSAAGPLTMIGVPRVLDKRIEGLRKLDAPSAPVQ